MFFHISHDAMLFKSCRRNRTFITIFVIALSFLLNVYIVLKVSEIQTRKLIPPTHRSGARTRSSVMDVPGDTEDTAVWPGLTLFSDRIVNQLKYRPKWVHDRSVKNGVGDAELKKILLYHGKEIWEVEQGRQTFLDQNCLVNTCYLTWDRMEMDTADAVLFRNIPLHERHHRYMNQIWIYFTLESPYNTRSLKFANGFYNWTATYRHDSDIVAPYEKYRPLDNGFITRQSYKNYAANKTKLVAWFVSKCTTNNNRMQYVKELSKHIQVDIYGQCGQLKCRRGNTECHRMLSKDYKFYLAFENSNCRDYITEKFFSTGLQ